MTTGWRRRPRRSSPSCTAQRVALAVEADQQHSADRERWLWMTYLAEATEMFSNSLDVRLTAAIVPQVLVPRLGRWCALHLLDQRGRLRLEALTHVDEDAAGRVCGTGWRRSRSRTAR